MLSIGGSGLASLWATLALLLVLSQALARLAARAGAPPIAGALAAGLLLSRDLLGGVWAPADRWLIPQTALQGHLLGGITNLALLLICFVLGMDTDVAALRGLGRSLAVVAGTTFLVPLAAGAALATAFPASFLGTAGNRFALVVLVAAALSVSSLPVIAWMLRELGVYRLGFGQLAVGTATSQDFLGFVLLAAGVAAAGSGGGRLVEVGVSLLAVVLLALRGGQWVGDLLLRKSDPDKGAPSATVLSVMVAAMLATAAVAQAVHLEGALGAFLAGVVFGRSPYHRHDAARVLDTVTTAVFAPLYFATAGLQLQLGLFRQSGVLWSFFAVVGVGAAGKLAGTLLAAPALALRRRELAVLAAVLNGRGAMQIIIASVGLRLSVISSGAFTVLVSGAVATSLLVAPVTRSLVTRAGAERSPGETAADTLAR